MASFFDRCPSRTPNSCSVQRGADSSHSFPAYRDLRDRNATLSGMVAYRIAPMGLQTSAGSRRVWGYLATGNYFDVLGVTPSLGRFFNAADDSAPGAAPFAVLSFSSWQNRLAGDPGIVGRTIRINGLPYTVVGVAPKGFRGTELFYSPELWVPMMMQPQIEGTSWLENRNTANSWVLGRIKAGVSKRQAEENLSGVATLVARERAAPAEPIRIGLTSPGLVGDTLRRPVRSFALAVMLLAGLVLLAACLNLASLFVARAVDRTRELGIRLALGAGQARLARQVAIEVFLFAMAGGLAGLVVARLLLGLLTSWHVPLDVPMQFDVDADLRVIAFAVLVAVVTGLAAALAPMWRVRRADVAACLRISSMPIASRHRVALRDLLLAIQVACCCVLITGGVVSLRGLAGAFGTPIGIQPDGVAVTSFDLGLAGYTRETGRAFQRRALDALASMPGVVAVAFGNSAPLYIDQSYTTVFPDRTSDLPRTAGKEATYYLVSPGFFRALGTRLIRGRDFTWQDDAQGAPVAIVNETFAKTLGNAEATGWNFRQGRRGPPIAVVGIVEDGKYQNLAEPPRSAVFFPSLQDRNNLTTFMIVRSSRPQAEAVAQLREVVSKLDHDLPLYSLGPLREILRFVFVPAWAATIALGVFGLLAAMLVVIGVYGLAAYSVNSRAREISIRVAIGARPGQVLQVVLGRVGILLLTGSVVGIVLGLAASRVLSSIVYHATPNDPIVLLAAALAMCAIGLAASWLPAKRALALDPVRALRED
jgi:predicted permease